MRPRLTTDYDPDGPPRATRMDEADRLLGKSVGRWLWFVVYLVGIGADPWHGLVGLVELGAVRLAAGIGIAVWAAVPLVYALEHLLLNVAEWRR